MIMDKRKNKYAVALGKLAAGKPKNFSEAERAIRRARMSALNDAREKNNQKSTAVTD